MRPIDADAAKKALTGWDSAPTDEEIEMAIDELPTLDYAPVVHGKWKYYHKQNRAVCIVCSFERDLDADFGRAIACPNCGAKTDGGKKDDKTID